jgi:hypothetical protein
VCADAVLVAVGTEPVVDWLSDSGAEISDGVLCDATSHVTGMGRIVAAQGFNSPRAMLQLADQVEASNPVPTEDHAFQRIAEVLTMIHHPAPEHRDPPGPQRPAVSTPEHMTRTTAPPRLDVIVAAAL